MIASDTFRGVYLATIDGPSRVLLDADGLELASWADLALDQDGAQLAIPDLFGGRVALCAFE